jgi:ATP-dependent helicase HrpB
VSPDRLPIEPLRPAFEETLAAGPVVVSSPTGSGKSTRVPTWCPAPVLVVEPRRVACRSLAQRVAELEGAILGRQVGYWVRDEKRVTEGTRITFATPGIALRIFGQVKRYATVVVDEFHERTLEVDLLLALLASRHVEPSGRLVVMSATLDGDRVAAHLGGQHLAAEGRQFPVEVEHLAGKTLLPDVAGLEARVAQALAARTDRPGDVLVFLPGKGEIESVARALDRFDVEVLPLHGGLSLGEQSRVFEPSRRKKVVLATNVAETSLTVPGVGGVIDSGLVRRTRYRDGRGFLTLVPVAMDSAEQRAGRAGRTAPVWLPRSWPPTEGAATSPADAAAAPPGAPAVRRSIWRGRAECAGSTTSRRSSCSTPWR